MPGALEMIQEGLYPPVLVISADMSEEDVKQLIKTLEEKGIKRICYYTKTSLPIATSKNVAVIFHDKYFCHFCQDIKNICLRYEIVLLDEDVGDAFYSPFRVIVRKDYSEDDLRDAINHAKIYGVYLDLPRINCGKCKFKTCHQLAKAIVKNEAKIEDCIILATKHKLVIRVDDEEIPLNPWVETLFWKIITSMLSSLKGVKVDGEDRVELILRKS